MVGSKKEKGRKWAKTSVRLPLYMFTILSLFCSVV